MQSDILTRNLQLVYIYVLGFILILLWVFPQLRDKIRANRFYLTPVWAPVEPPAKRAKTAEVRLSSASEPMTPRSDDNAKSSSDEEDSDSSGSNSDVSSQDDSSDVSDLEKFEEAYTDFGALTAGVDPRTLERDCSGHPNEEVPGLDLPGGMEALHSLANVPKSWPLNPALNGLISGKSRLVKYYNRHKACFVNSSLRFLILNLHPICTCSC